MRLFKKKGSVSKCEVYVAEKRVIGLPLMEWDRLVSEVNRKFVEGRR